MNSNSTNAAPKENDENKSSSSTDPDASSKADAAITRTPNTAPRKLITYYRQYASSLIVASKGACKASAPASSGGTSRVEEALMITMNRSRDIMSLLSDMEDTLLGFEGCSAKRALERYSELNPCALKKAKKENSLSDKNMNEVIELVDDSIVEVIDIVE